MDAILNVGIANAKNAITMTIANVAAASPLVPGPSPLAFHTPLEAGGQTM